MISILIASRLALVAVFLTSAIAKLLDRKGTVDAVAHFGVPASSAPAVALALPAAELSAALLLVPAATAWWGAALSLALLAAFSIAIAVNLAAGRTPACNCFGQVRSSPISRFTLLRNGLFAVPAVTLVLGGSGDPGPGLLAWTLHMNPAETALTVLVLVLAVGLALAVRAVRRLSIEHQALRDSMRVMEQLFDTYDARVLDGQSVAPAGTQLVPQKQGAQLPAGSLAPEFVVSTRDNRLESLSALLALGRPVLLVFVNRNCRACHDLLPTVATWATTTNLTVRAITTGALAEHSATLAAHPDLPLTFAGEQRIAEQYLASWSPAGVLIDGTGRIAEPMAYGADAITALVTKATRPVPLPRAWPALRFDAEMPDGRVVSSASLTNPNGTVVLAWASGCSFCGQLTGDLQAYQHSKPERGPDLVLVVRNRDFISDRFGAAVVIDVEGRIGQTLGGLRGTPGAVWMTPDGRVAPYRMNGPFEVRALLGIPNPPELIQSLNVLASAS